VLISQSSGRISRGNSGDTDADDRRTVGFLVGGTSENSTTDSNVGTNSFHRVYQTQPPSCQQTAYYYNNQQPRFDQPLSSLPVLLRNPQC